VLGVSAAVLASLLVAAFAGESGARSLYTISLDTRTTTTGISGIAGSRTATIGNPGTAVYGIYKLQWAEKGDVPCNFLTYTHNVDTGAAYGGRIWDACSGVPGNFKTATLTGSQIFVRGIAICDAGSNARIKGVRLYGVKVYKTKQETDNLLGYVEAKHTNCKTWRKAVFCSDGKLATAAMIHHDFSGKSSQAAVGISLEFQIILWL
jgi:hypothetical protein